MQFCTSSYTPALILPQATDTSSVSCVASLRRWQFGLEEQVSHPSNGGPLFVGSLPARQPDAYYALLPMRAPKMTKVCTLRALTRE